MVGPRLTVAATLLLGAVGLVGCTTGAPGGLGGSPGQDGASAYSCATTPGSGCPCTTEGATADCGQVVRTSGNYVTCSIGETTCSNGTWGVCVGDRITTKSYGTSAVSLQGLGTPQQCVDDPCDPNCNQYVDTPPGLPLAADSGLVIAEAGLTPGASIISEAGIECTGLVVTPPTSNVVVTGLSPITTSPAAIDLTASYTPPDCYSGVVNAAWSLDKTDLAAISGGVITLVSAVSGPITATAYSSGFQASGVVNVTTNVVDTTQAPAGTASQFNGPGTVPDNIQILYPYPATVFPRGIAAPVVQWNNNGVAATAVKVTIQYPATGTPTYLVALILPEGTPPQAPLGQAAWGFLDQTAAGQDALISIQRLVGGVLRQPTTETVHFGTSALRGNIYYTEYDVNAWTGTVKSLLPFGTTPAAVALSDNGGCPVCHTVSAQGNMLITSNWGPADDTISRVNSDGSLTPIAYMGNNPTGSDSRGFAYSAITPDGLYGLQGSNWWGNTFDSNVSTQTTRPHNNGWGLLGSYYANPTFSGTAALTRTDGTVDFVWSATSPGAGITAGSSYSVDWTGFVQPVFTETYTFGVESSDGVLLTVNGQTLISALGPQADTTLTGTIALTAGVKTPISLKYENVSNAAQVHLRWNSPSQPLGVIPETQLYPALLPVIPPCTPGQYLGCYTDSGNRDLPANPAINPVTVENCEAACGTAGYTYAGLQYASQCFCGDSYGSYGPSTNCNMACDGNGAEICGGGWANSVYSAACPTNPSSGLLATYYANQDFTGTAFTRIDPGVNFDWNGGSPAPGVGGNNWSAEWTGQVTVPCSDNYFWCVEGDDGVRLWVDGVLVDDGWVDEGPTWYCNSVTGNAIAETAGTHDIKMDYYQDTGGSLAALFWSAGCIGGDAEIPQANLSPTGDQGTGGYGTPFHNGGDRGTGVPYSILQLSPVVNTPPVDVSAMQANTWGLGPTAMMAPTFSPDGTKLVFVDGDTAGGATWRQGLSFFNFNEGSQQFSGRTSFVNTIATQNIVRWPAVEPDSRSVIYQTNPFNADDQQYGGMLPSGYSSIEGELWSVDMEDPGGHPAVPLTTLNAGLGAYDANLSYQASVLPTSAGGYRWTVFTSDRQYGNTQNTVAGDNTDQLWVGALDDTLSVGGDRSHPPFWLPNQVLGDNGGRIRNERGYWVLPACKPSLANLNPPPPPTLPTFNWTDKDIGSVGFPGSASVNGGVFTVVGGGDDIWNQADAFNYAYTPVSGDFVFQARVTYLAWASAWSKAGVMLRDDLAPGSAHAITLMNAEALTGVEWRPTSNASTNWTQGPGEFFPYWVQIARSGTVVTGSVSPDGVNWTIVDQESPSIGANAYVGLAVTAQNNGTTTTATFDSVGFAAPAQPDPRPASLCQDNQDCCGALTNPPTAACVVDVPVQNPVTRHCLLNTANSCVPIGGVCTSDSDCCGFPNDRCDLGFCAATVQGTEYTEVVYTQDYVAACPAQTQIVWRFFDWQTITPGNSDIRFLAGSAQTQAALPTVDTAASVVYLGEASGAPITVWTGADVGAALTAASQSPSQSYLRIFVDFQPTSDHTEAPVLTEWRQQFDCVASE